MDDFRLSTNPIMAKAWKERLEPAMEMYGNEIGYGKLLFNDLTLGILFIFIQIHLQDLIKWPPKEPS